MTNRPVKLSQEWLNHLQMEFEQPYMQDLSAFLRQEKSLGKTIYPESKNIFAALDAVSPQDLNVVILGQDPYHGPKQAHGLSFSVPVGERIPPSLVNIYKELQDDLGCDYPPHGNLQSWSEQGVLLLNSVLSVEKSKAASHQGKGWERFTDKIISVINNHCENVVFLLWGAYAQKKGQIVDKDRHMVLHAPHPSPLSAHRGFLGCKHFSQTNNYLKKAGRLPIDWQIK